MTALDISHRVRELLPDLIQTARRALELEESHASKDWPDIDVARDLADEIKSRAVDIRARIPDANATENIELALSMSTLRCAVVHIHQSTINLQAALLLSNRSPRERALAFKVRTACDRVVRFCDEFLKEPAR